MQQAVAQIPWGHAVVLMDKISGGTIRNWYVRKTIENGWSRNVLLHQIGNGLYQRQEIADKISNFENCLEEIILITRKKLMDRFEGSE